MADEMPLFPDEKTIAHAVMGPTRAKDWPAKARYLEKAGLPLIDELMGGRFWPAVVEYFRERHGLGLDADNKALSKSIRVVPFKPDGKENYKP